MKKIILLIIALSISLSIFAQNDAKAVTILDKVSKQYEAYKGVSILFTFSLENTQEDIEETSKGKAWAKGNKYKLEAMGAETYFDGVSKWLYMIDAEEVNLSAPEKDDKDFFNPSELFNSYQEGYRIRYVKEMFEHNRALHYIDLFPTQELVKSSDFSRIKLKIDKDKNQIYQIIRFGKDGNNYTITLNKMTEEKALSDALFIFDTTRHPDVELIDLRD